MFKLDNYNKYIGPKALFDPAFIPPHLLFRKKEQSSLNSILTDSLSDEFCLNILYQGINGIGKNAIVNIVINDITFQNKDLNDINKVCINCNEKTFEELIFSIISSLTGILKLKFNLESLLNSNISHLWNIFKLLCKKINNKIFFVFSNVEHLKPKIIKKLMIVGKESNITSIYTINKILRGNLVDFLSEFDLKKKLSYFSYNELYSILKQRICLSISHPVDRELIKYITDLICEQYVPVPGKGIEILRDLYPIFRDKHIIRNRELIELCQNHFDQMQINDEFSMLNYISEEEFLNIIFLDNLSNNFISQMKYYISLDELKEIYHISCESLEYNKNFNEFQNLIRKLLNIGIIRRSKRNKHYSKQYFVKKDLKDDIYFMIISPNQLKTIIDTIFENFQSI
ncbi:hypothetical protein LCGC14_0492940 [marine sediment metagenome]|uniref:Cdc6 C-terminal domain-containing protein n=1 Tax=marine sediment metagenome TaxID=412755 RepID=A0A0F9UT41_9ZZZZ|nr:MAG: cell division control protein 6 [Candidatus Lokiarchaeum sp. GC14_75]